MLMELQLPGSSAPQRAAGIVTNLAQYAGRCDHEPEYGRIYQ